MTSRPVPFELVFTLESHYRVDLDRINDFGISLLDLRGLSVEGKEVFREALDLYAERSLSFADAFNACLMKSQGITEAYSHDRDFDNVPGIRRRSP